MSRRASARIQKNEDDAADKNRSIYTDVEKKYKRSRRRHLDMLENSNFGCHRSNVDVVITASGGEVDDVASEMVGKKQKKTRAGREQQQMSKKPLGQILFEAEEMNADLPKWVPTYNRVATQMPDEPPRQFCAICGARAPYTCSRCGVRYCRRRCYGTHCETRCLKWAAE